MKIKNIAEKISDLLKQEISNFKLLALVTDTSYEVLLYIKEDGEYIQVNNLLEEKRVIWNDLEGFYDYIAEEIRNSIEFNAEKMNIFKMDSKGESKLEYEERNCRIYGLKKEWKKESLIM